MNSFSLTCFGVGDGWPCADRCHSAFLYRFGESALLVDCGEPISRSLMASGAGFEAFDQLVVSHLNFDHIGGFFMLMQSCWLERRRKELPVRLPADGIEPIRRMLDAGCIYDELLPFRLRFEPLADGQPFAVGNVRVTPWLNRHLEGFRAAFGQKHPQNFAAYSFVLEGSGLRVGHTADLGSAADLEPLLRQPLDLLVCELAHFPPVDLFGRLRGRAVKRVVFVHLARPFWDDLEATRQMLNDGLRDVPFAIARDGEEINL